MKDLHNIEKSAFRRGEYVGYARGKVWRISKTAYGGWKWVATSDDAQSLYADRLIDLSKVLERGYMTKSTVD